MQKKEHFYLTKCPFSYYTVDEGGFNHTYPLSHETYPHFENTCNIGFQKSELSDTSQNTPITCSNCFGPARQFLATFVTSLMLNTIFPNPVPILVM